MSEWWSYFNRLEVMAFFIGYPLLYAAVLVIGKNSKYFFLKASHFLPYAYALSGTLFLGLLLRNLYPDYSPKNISTHFSFSYSYLKIWALLSLLFWIPFFSKKLIVSLFHSLVFFFFFVKDIFFSADPYMRKNEIKIYSDSLLLNAITLTCVLLFSFLIKKFKRKKLIQ